VAAGARPRFGLPAHQSDACITAYGHDIRTWDGYPILHEIRELSTLNAVLRDGHIDRAAGHEPMIRLQSLSEPMWKPLIGGLGIYSGTALGSCTI